MVTTSDDSALSWAETTEDKDITNKNKTYFMIFSITTVDSVWVLWQDDTL